MNCDTNICRGNKEGTRCTHHSECDSKLFCNEETLRCQKLRLVNEGCYQTYECQLGYICARNYSRTDLNGTCEKIYSLPQNNKAIVPQECISGNLDVQTKQLCASYATSVSQTISQPLQYPYKCEANLAQRCTYRDDQLVTIGSQNCFCSSVNLGYCPLDYTLEKQQMNILYAQIELRSTQCHTLERSLDRRLSIFAMISCGPGITDQTVQRYLEYNYNYTYYMFANNENIQECFDQTLYTSWTNIKVLMKEANKLMQNASELKVIIIIFYAICNY
eukprot:403354224